ncbi:MAG: SpoIIE family protein phosphatase [Bacteroidales bacterium]|nr:SpoIIE family protein phosphatase [Bacteroidales bacterium]
MTFNSTFSVKEISNNEIWVGTNNGIFITDANGDTAKLIQNNPNGPSVITNNSVYSIYKDRAGNVWVGTASGLNKYMEGSGTFAHYTEKNGLPNNLIYNILEDNRKNLWISTNRGLSKFNYAMEKFNSYDLVDGLQNYEYNIGASYTDSEGNMYFGGISGLNKFHPDSIDLNKFVPNVVITSLTFYGEDASFTNGDVISLKAGQSIFTIDFAALDFTQSTKNRYKYRLFEVNHPNGWINLGTNHTATFTNIKPGNYILQIMGSNNDGIWNEEGVELKVNVASPFFRSNTAVLVYIGLCIFIIYLFFLYRTKTLRKLNREYQERERINQQIAIQKEQLIIKNKNITDSINYAKRIQEAMMPPKSLFKKLLKDSFVLHRPKDIVSGDFYWINENNGKVFVAAVDCTGHGVPGAFMSIIGFELFKRITNIHGVEEPAQILNILNESFKDIFKDVDNFTLRDGMDIAFCVLDKRNNVLEFSGAFNPLYLIRDNKLSEIKGDRFSVGIDDNLISDQNFTNHSVTIEPDDMVYIFSDGYADQFGGPEEKKFKYRRFRHILLTIHKLPMEKQKEILDQTIDDWRGRMDQVDDILIIGFKPYSNMQ